MNPELIEFISILTKEDRSEALRFILELKEKKNLSILEVYEEFLTPALNEMTSTDNENIDIWKEHVRTSMIRTIIENMVPFLEEEQKAFGPPRGNTAAVLCPPEEYHDVGARMAADILTIAGYRTIFVGSNTPFRVFEAGLEAERIDYVAISISNPYHLVSTRRIVDGIRAGHPNVKIILGGNAILKHPDMSDVMKPDYISMSLKDLTRLEGGNDHETGL